MSPGVLALPAQCAADASILCPSPVPPVCMLRLESVFDPGPGSLVLVQKASLPPEDQQCHIHEGMWEVL